MSHELRTPLNAILGFSEILQRELFGPLSNNAYRDYAQDIHVSGRYLLGIINDILDISRIEAGRRELDEKPVALIALAERAIDISRVTAERKNIELVMEFQALTPKILGDEHALQQVAVNLISNAVKFSSDGGSVAVGADRIGTGEVAFFVRDNGPGMAQDELEHVLEAFTRGRHASTKAIEGTGLGLSIVNGIMQLHGGRVVIESRPGQGTTVNCIFPAKRVLSGPRATMPETLPNASDTQQKLIKLTG
jgi:two-component system cell cycle sensor histidine kinase PleC